MLYGEEEPPPGEKGVISWNHLVNLGQATTDTILDTRLANIAINQVILLFFPVFVLSSTCAFVCLAADDVTYANMSAVLRPMSKHPSAASWRTPPALLDILKGPC